MDKIYTVIYFVFVNVANSSLYNTFCFTKKLPRCFICQAHVAPSTINVMIPHQVAREFTISERSLNRTSRSLISFCSLLIDSI